MNLLLAIIFSILLINVNDNIKHVDSCYITNCPWGGKRSIKDILTSDLLSDESKRQCNKCANGLGTCFGPRICCGPEIGCLLDSKETLSCKQEDVKSSLPCTPYGRTCESVAYGRCATKHLCCNPDGCVSDSTCSSSDLDDLSVELNDLKERKEKSLEKKIIEAIKVILKEKQNVNENDNASDNQ